MDSGPRGSPEEQAVGLERISLMGPDEPEMNVEPEPELEVLVPEHAHRVALPDATETEKTQRTAKIAVTAEGVHRERAPVQGAGALAAVEESPITPSGNLRITRSSTSPASETLWVKGLQLDDDAGSVRRKLATVPGVKDADIQKVTVRLKKRDETELHRRQTAEAMANMPTGRALRSWEVRNFWRGPERRQDDEVAEELESWALVTVSSHGVAEAVLCNCEMLGWNVNKQDTTKMKSAEAKTTSLFHTYGDADELELGFDDFQRLMVTEFDAQPEAIRMLWHLPGFCSRQQNVEQKEVVTGESFKDSMTKLGLLQLLGTQHEVKAEIPIGQMHTDEMLCCEKCIDRCTRSRCCCVRCCVQAGGDRPRVRFYNPSYDGTEPKSKWCCLQPNGLFSAIRPWDAWMQFLVVYVSLTLPVRLGFELPMDHHGDPGLPYWFISDVCTDVSFLIDIFINFSSPYAVEHDEWVSDARKVHIRYLFGEMVSLNRTLVVCVSQRT